MKAQALTVIVGAWFFAALRTSTAALPVPATGANVDESRVTKILYVDPAHTEAADDAKHGTADAPFATLAFACEAAARAKDANVGVKLVLAAGTYREAAAIPPPAANARDTDAPLVIEAAEREQAVLDGADTEGWSPSTWKTEEARWTHPWPFRRGGAAARPAGQRTGGAPGECYRRGDLVIVNGTLLRQVNAAADLAPGCFWVRIPVPNGGRYGNTISTNVGATAVVQPPEDTELAGAIIQVGVRPRGLTITGRRNVVVRGLLIQHAADPGGEGERTAGVVLDRCANVLVEDVLSQWNDGTGMAISGDGTGEGVTLRRVRLLHNGGSGLEVSKVKNLLAEDNETSFNNFRGEWAGWIDPQGPAAVKVAAVQGSAWRRQHVVGNACQGMWWDGEDADVTVEEGVIRNNLIAGMLVENNVGPVLLRRCLIAGTKISPGAREKPRRNGGLVVARHAGRDPGRQHFRGERVDPTRTRGSARHAWPLRPTARLPAQRFFRRRRRRRRVPDCRPQTQRSKTSSSYTARRWIRRRIVFGIRPGSKCSKNASSARPPGRRRRFTRRAGSSWTAGRPARRRRWAPGSRQDPGGRTRSLPTRRRGITG